MTADMRVLVFDGPHRFHIETRPRPAPGPGEVRLRMAYVGICGSDLHGYTGESGRRLPGMIMGHEASGWVEELGPGVEGPAIGTPVTFNPSLPCDGACGHRFENHCAALRVIGVTPDIQGAFADRHRGARRPGGGAGRPEHAVGRGRRAHGGGPPRPPVAPVSGPARTFSWSEEG